MAIDTTKLRMVTSGPTGEAIDGGETSLTFTLGQDELTIDVESVTPYDNLRVIVGLAEGVLWRITYSIKDLTGLATPRPR